MQKVSQSTARVPVLYKISTVVDSVDLGMADWKFPFFTKFLLL